MSKEMYFALRKFFQSSLFEEANVSSPSRESFLLGIHVRPASSLSRILYERIVFRCVYSTDYTVSLLMVEGLVKDCAIYRREYSRGLMERGGWIIFGLQLFLFIIIGENF